MIMQDFKNKPLLVYGAGGHGHVVAEAAELAGFQVLGFLDDQAKPGDEMRLPLFQLDDERAISASIIVGIGHNMARRRITEDLIAAGREIATVVHPSAYVSKSAELGIGVFVGPNAVVHSEANIEKGVIINSGSVVEHHNRVGKYAHVGPGAAMGGNVTVRDYALVGLGARVLPSVEIGEETTVGAGCVVTKNLPGRCTAVGCPAKIIITNSQA